MKFINLLIVCLLFSEIDVQAQKHPAHFSDNFIDSIHPWAIVDSSYGSTYILDGEYYIAANGELGTYSVIPGVTLKKNSNFKLSFTAHWRSGVENYNYGICWGKDFKSHSSRFLASNIGWLDIWTGENKQMRPIPSSFCPFLNNNEENHFKIEYQNKKAKLFVNDHLVYDGKLTTSAGRIYFIIYNRQTVSFDNIDLEYEQ